MGAPDPLTPMGIVDGYGKIVRALDDPNPRRRRAAWIMYLAFALPFLTLLAFLVFALVRG